MLASGFARLDLVLREDFEVQQKLLERAQAKLAELEARIAELEAVNATRRSQAFLLAGGRDDCRDALRAERSRESKRPK